MSCSLLSHVPGIHCHGNIIAISIRVLVTHNDQQTKCFRCHVRPAISLHPFTCRETPLLCLYGVLRCHSMAFGRIPIIIKECSELVSTHYTYHTAIHVNNVQLVIV